MDYILENEQIKLIVNTFACQMHSLIKKDENIEYIWQADPKYWTGRNPTLFPHVSASKNKILYFKGKPYQVGNHGFVRRSEFEFISQTADSLTFRLKDNEATLKEYPYHFELWMQYQLKDNCVSINYTIKNIDNEIMPFGFGLHPAFNCPLTDENSFEDYHIEFNNGKQYQLSYQDLKEKETVVFDDIDFTEAYLTDGKHGVKMNFEGYKIFAVWSPIAPFVCLEPWINHLDKTKEYPMPFEEVEGLNKLNPQEEFKISYSISIQ